MTADESLAADRRKKSGARKCRWCNLTRADHLGDRNACPGLGGRYFAYRPSLSRAATSFSVGEIDALEIVLGGLRSGKDLRHVARSFSKPLGQAAIRFANMRKSIAARKAGR